MLQRLAREVDEDAARLREAVDRHIVDRLDDIGRRLNLRSERRRRRIRLGLVASYRPKKLDGLRLSFGRNWHFLRRLPYPIDRHKVEAAMLAQHKLEVIALELVHQVLDLGCLAVNKDDIAVLGESCLPHNLPAIVDL
eukprot:5582631-Prymnesium_polylepis.1